MREMVVGVIAAIVDRGAKAADARVANVERELAHHIGDGSVLIRPT
jgi:hypothetical protein